MIVQAALDRRCGGGAASQPRATKCIGLAPNANHVQDRDVAVLTDLSSRTPSRGEREAEQSVMGRICTRVKPTDRLKD
jgi:hypothetical protein